MKAQTKALSLALITSLMVLPGCSLSDWLGGKKCDKMSTEQGPATDDGSEVLVTISGSPLITKNMLETEKKKLFENNPQLQAMAGLMDENQLNRNLIDGLASREVIRKYIHDNNVEESDKYKKDYESVMARLKDALYTQYFMESLKVDVADADIKQYYEANKDTIPNLLISRGGVEARGVPFNSEVAAKEFASKVKAARNDIDKVAKESNMIARLKDFKLVNDQSLGLDPELKNKIAAISTTPSVETFKVGKEFWVVAATRKEEAKYRPYEQVTAELADALKKERTMKAFEQEVGRLKNDYQIVINETKFSEKSPADLDVQAAQNDAEEAQAPVEVAEADLDEDVMQTKAA